jgi:hypothetical protein
MPDAKLQAHKSRRLALALARKTVRHPKELFLMFRMASWIGVVTLVARLWSLPKALEFVSGKDIAGSRDRADLDKRLANTLDQLLAADVVFLKPKCWKRAAVLRRYLSKNGIPTTIVFGVRRDTQGNLDGHAWLEFEGEPILESSPPEYVVTYRYPETIAL